MTASTDTLAFDLAAFTAAIEGRDADSQVSAYADDAELVLVDHDHTPSNPLVIRGTDALRAHFGDIYGRDMTHQVTAAAMTGDRLTVEVSCRYPDGARVSCLCIAGLSEGRIIWQHGLQVWDH